MIIVMATVSISLFHSEFGNDISFLFSGRQNNCNKTLGIPFVHGKRNKVNGTCLYA